jgi:DNA-binding response OmpR family regulator
MKILLASSDRDLLECYKILLEADLGQTVTAFDGTQVLSLLSSEAFDTAVLDDELPRIEFGKLINQAHEKNIPVIALTNGADTGQTQADAYLKYPFDYDKIKRTLIKTLSDAGKEDGNE